MTRGYRAVAIRDVPALEGRDDPGWWADWSRDPDFGPGWHSINAHLGITGFGIAGCSADAGKELIVPHAEGPYTGQEEVYVVLAGAGRMKLDDAIIDVRRLDAIRVAPGVTRQFEAGPDGLEILAVGARHEGDGELVPDWWTD